MMRTVGRADVLSATAAVPHRSFTHPDHVAADRAVLCMLLRDFAAHLATTTAGRPAVRYIPHPDEWHRRVVIPQPEAVIQHDEITVVGFFGRVNDVVDPEVADRIKELSDQLVDAVITAPGVLGYSTHLLADERNYANLVLLDSTDAIERWRSTSPHPTAAGECSPRYYQYVRIYRGAIPSTQLDGEGALRLDLVKYWDYRSEPVWHGVRTLH